jgi:heme/copper-type cytochrome/quinol oxidase subunit 3
VKEADIDVSSLPTHTLDHRSPIWWGNVLLLVIESVMFGILIASYFYLYKNFSVWPPVRTSTPEAYYTLPQLHWGTINLIVMLVGVLPAVLADRAALRRKTRLVEIGTVLTVLFGLVAIWFRWKEFGGLAMRWDDNAYASITWMILGMHFCHLIVGTLETALMAAWLLSHGMDDQHARDVRLSSIYWYWIVAIWVPLYFVVYFAPRWL